MDDMRWQRVARHLFHKSSDALFLFDPGGHRVLDANAAARRLTGFGMSALRAMTLEALFAATGPDEGTGVVAPDRDEAGAGADAEAGAFAFPRRAPRREYRLRRRRGTPIAVQVGVIASKAEAPAPGLAVVRGADARPMGPEVLDRFFALGPELLAVGAYDGRILEANPAWGRTLGYTAGELVGGSIWDLIHPSAVDVCTQASSALTRGGITDLEVRMRHKDGSDRWISWSVAFLEGRLFAVGRDVTAHRQLEDGLHQAREAAAAAHRAKSEFLAGMSHEIRTPMTAILGFADLLAERWRRPGANAAPEDLDALQTIKRNGDLLLGLINDILDLAKIEADRTHVALAPCSPAQLVADVMGLMNVRAEAQGLSLGVEFLTPIPATIATDAVRLRQILVNLIGNAIKFTDHGGVRLRVRVVRSDDADVEAEGNGDGTAHRRRRCNSKCSTRASGFATRTSPGCSSHSTGWTRRRPDGTAARGSGWR